MQRLSRQQLSRQASNHQTAPATTTPTAVASGTDVTYADPPTARAPLPPAAIYDLLAPAKAVLFGVQAMAPRGWPVSDPMSHAELIAHLARQRPLMRWLKETPTPDGEVRQLAGGSHAVDLGALAELAGLRPYFDFVFQRSVMTALRLKGCPDPDACAYAARIFDLPPAEVTLIQTDPACMAAARAAGLGTIIGIGQGDLADRLYEAGATAVVMALPESAEP